jgi:cyclohexanone monooxygenase
VTTGTSARAGRIDAESLRRKYREERDKRIRADGNDQYLRLADEFAHYRDDPHTP